MLPRPPFEIAQRYRRRNRLEAIGRWRATLVAAQTTAAVERRMPDTNPPIAKRPLVVTLTFAPHLTRPARNTRAAVFIGGCSMRVLLGVQGQAPLLGGVGVLLQRLEACNAG